MRILFDQGTPQPLRQHLIGHVIDTVYERSWSTLKNGVLLAAAKRAGYDLFMTTDQNLRFQQNLSGLRLAIVVLRTTSWPMIRMHVDRVQTAIAAATAGSYDEVIF